MLDTNPDIDLKVDAKIVELLRWMTRHKLFMVGFVFGMEDGPGHLTNFGNCTDAGKLELYKTLIQTTDTMKARGKAEVTVVHGDEN